MITYRINPLFPEHHLYEVMLVLKHPNVCQQFRLPVWIPGSYLIREFTRHIVSISALADGQKVALNQLDKATWSFCSADKPAVLEIKCLIYAYDLSVREAYLDSERGFFNASSLCLSVKGYEHEPCLVEILPPPGKERHWRVATGLLPETVDEQGFGVYQAADYDELIDSPVEMGTFSSVSFQVSGISHQLVVSGCLPAFDLQRLVQDCQRICQTEIDFFGNPLPFDHYVFLLNIGEGLYGGLEHRCSTALMASPENLPIANRQDMSEDYIELLGLISHEYFHSWNVKRIKPAAYSPYDLTRENYTRLLWAFEGITSYYDDLLLLRSGVIDSTQYLTLLARNITRYLRTPGRLQQTLEQSSFEAWTKYYRQDENSPNAIVSYYIKGALAALCLDLLIRQSSEGEQSLDNIMKALWQKWQKDGLGLGETEWETFAVSVTGLDLKPFFDLALRSTENLPLSSLLASQGISCQFIAANNRADVGGCRNSKLEGTSTPSLGVNWVKTHEGIKLKHVLNGGAAQTAGLSAGDIIIAIDGCKVRHLDKYLTRYAVSDSILVHAFRRERLFSVEVCLQKAVPDTCYLNIIDHDQVTGWLGR